LTCLALSAGVRLRLPVVSGVVTQLVTQRLFAVAKLSSFPCDRYARRRRTVALSPVAGV